MNYLKHEILLSYLGREMDDALNVKEVVPSEHSCSSLKVHSTDICDDD